MARRRKLAQDIKSVLKQEHSASLIPATFLVMALLDAVPVPTDVGYFYVQRWLEENRDKISPKKRWIIQYANYYGWDMTWYGSLFLLTYFGGRSAKEKLILGAGALTAGVLATMYWKFSHPNLDLPSPEVERLVTEAEEQGISPTIGAIT